MGVKRDEQRARQLAAWRKQVEQDCASGAVHAVLGTLPSPARRQAASLRDAWLAELDEVPHGR